MFDLLIFWLQYNTKMRCLLENLCYDLSNAYYTSSVIYEFQIVAKSFNKVHSFSWAMRHSYAIKGCSFD